MEKALTTAEVIGGFLPIGLPIAALFIDGMRQLFTASAAEVARTKPTNGLLICSRPFWQAFCAILACTAAWALTEAVISAVNLGVISLPGRRGSSRPLVFWGAAWTYLLGMVLVLLAAAIPWLTKQGSESQFLLALASLALGALGYLLVGLSPLLSSWLGTGVTMAVLVAGLAYVLRRLLSAQSSRPSENDV